jgi:hypothetical protein
MTNDFIINTGLKTNGFPGRTNALFVALRPALFFFNISGRKVIGQLTAREEIQE